MDKVIKESHRLFPPVAGTHSPTLQSLTDRFALALVFKQARHHLPLLFWVLIHSKGISRTMTEDVVIMGHKIPKDTIVGIAIYSIHRNPQDWEDPEKFDPNRFNKKNPNNFAFVPFSAGPRKYETLPSLELGSVFNLPRLFLTCFGPTAARISVFSLLILLVVVLVRNLRTMKRRPG